MTKPASASGDHDAGGAQRRSRCQRQRGMTIFLVDQRPWTREGLARALETASRDLRVVRLAEAAELTHGHAQIGPAALILLNWAGHSGSEHEISEAIAAARSRRPDLPVVALSERADPDEILALMKIGLNGYISLSSELGMVISALRYVLAGGTFISSELLLSQLDESTSAKGAGEVAAGQTKSSGPVNDAASPVLTLESLTPREHSVLRLIRQGKPNKQIARELDACEATIKVHVRHIMRKLGASNRTQAALVAEALDQTP